MTRNEFYCNALLLIASNSTFAHDMVSNTMLLTQWAKWVGLAADALLDVAEKNNCLDDEPP